MHTVCLYNSINRAFLTKLAQALAQVGMLASLQVIPTDQKSFANLHAYQRILVAFKQELDLSRLLTKQVLVFLLVAECFATLDERDSQIKTKYPGWL